MVDFIKMSNLVNEDITIESVLGFQWKLWDNANNKMLVSDNWQKDYQKRWQVVTDKGQVDMSQSQMANMLEGVAHAGKSDIIGCTFNVKSNGKPGKEIRYWINAVKTAPKEDINQDIGSDEWEPRSDW